jgi:hypothetical protein
VATKVKPKFSSSCVCRLPAATDEADAAETIITQGQEGGTTQQQVSITMSSSALLEPQHLLPRCYTRQIIEQDCELCLGEGFFLRGVLPQKNLADARADGVL